MDPKKTVNPEPKLKKQYRKPELKEWGTVAELTNAKGNTFKTDFALTGSNH